MKSGRRPERAEVEDEGADVDKEDDEGEEVGSGEGETRSIIRLILSSSSGQISGQCVKPKYT